MTHYAITRPPVPGREIGRPEFRSEDDLIAWIAREAGTDEAEVRTARRNAAERRGRRGPTPTGDAALDRARAAIAAALDARATVTPRATAPTSSSTTTSPTTTTTRTADDDHIVRAARYGA